MAVVLRLIDMHTKEFQIFHDARPDLGGILTDAAGED